MAKQDKERATGYRAAPISAKAKEERRNNIREQRNKADGRIAAHRKTLETKTRQLEDASKTSDENASLEQQAEYATLKEEVEALKGMMMEYETDVERLAREDREIEEMNVDSGQDRLGLSTGNQTNGGDDDILFTPAQAREATGQNHGGKIVAWRQQDRSKPVIVMYGPRNAAKYELSTAAKEDDDFDEKTTEQFGPDHRLGDEKIGKKFIRRRRELLGAEGMAYNCPLDELQPKEKGETRRLPPLGALIRWEINGVIQKTWEVRSSIRHLFNSPKKCDIYLYEVAKHHAARHQEWLDGKRKGGDKSPTPGPNGEVKLEEDGGERTKKPGAPMMEFREQWCELNNIDPAAMDPPAQGRFLAAWKEVKDRY